MVRTLLFCLLAALAFGCASPDIHLQNLEDLDSGSKLIEQGKLAEATPVLERVILRTNEAPATFEKQRFFSVYLLSKAHTEAALVTDRGRSAERFGWVSDLLRAGYYRGFAKEWQPAAGRSGAKSPTGQPLLPPQLASLDVDQSAAYMDLAWIITYARMKDQRKARRDLLSGRMGFVYDFEATVAFCEELQIPEQMAAWLHYGLFDILRLERDTQKEAYKFGVTAREDRFIQHLPPRTTDRIADWIEFEADFRWESSNGVPFDRSGPVIDRESVINFKARPLTPAELESRRRG